MSETTERLVDRLMEEWVSQPEDEDGDYALNLDGNEWREFCGVLVREIDQAIQAAVAATPMPDGLLVARGTCRGCGKALLWATTAEGKRIPFDARSTRFLVWNSGDPPDVPTRYGIMEGHVNHFVTCPERDQFRKGGGGR